MFKGLSAAQRTGGAFAIVWLLALIALPFVATSAALGKVPYIREWTFIAAAMLLTFELMAIGGLVSGDKAGIIIDNRKCVSLSRFQAAAWTVLVFAALVTAAAFNLASGAGNALDIKIPSDLLVAMGISATSLAATPALLSLKAAQDVPDATVTTAGLTSATAAAAAGNPAAAEHVGALATNSSIDNARLTDLVTGDEVGNWSSPDLGKIQQLLITLLLIGVYAVMLGNRFAGPGQIVDLPPLDPGFIWLMGVSHASYLAYKAAPHTN